LQSLRIPFSLASISCHFVSVIIRAPVGIP
jgi:hypothetical protein